MKQWIAWGILSIFAWKDFRAKELPFPWLLAAFLLGAVNFFFSDDGTFLSAIQCLLTGCLVLLLSRASREAIGSGDGWVLMDIGWFLGGAETFALFLCGLFLASVWSAVWLLSGKGGRKKSFAFVPFLWIAETGLLLGGGCL
ncbi:prepilin peptidase [Hominifimenecus sp. rT4P-3]|uniref:prepilin peptidase n=1 Tax=Hominifimenecus sp. rT4P-3 TaxID=3242979 RepID=UPI003DA43929